MKSKKSILVTGVHRSGTTWLANMLNFGGGTEIVDEPFNLGDWAYSLDDLAEKWYAYIGDVDENLAKAAYQRILDNKVRKVYPRRSLKHWLPPFRVDRKIIKDPICALSSEWLAETFDFKVVVVVRHPMAFVKSLQRMEWAFPFEDLLSQEKLMVNHLKSFSNELTDAKNMTFNEQAIIVWKCIYSVLKTYLDNNPSWIQVRHEDISLDPIVGFETLYNQLDLNWSDEVVQQISSFTGDDNPSQAEGKVTHQMKRNSKDLIQGWKNSFDENEISKLRKLAEPVSKHFYSDTDWSIA